MRVLAALSGGVDSSVAAALLLGDGHDVVGVTMKLWGGPSDSGCCSVADVEDARRVAQQLGIDHWVFNFSEQFDADVVRPYVHAHASGRTPNPCIECNRHLKFERLLHRAEQLGFDAVATGHHARIRTDGGRYRLRRGADPAKDQSYVLYVLGQDQLARSRFPVGELTKAEVRARAAALGLRTAAKPDSQDVCFVLASGGRAAFLGPRIDLHPGRVVDRSGVDVGLVDAVELVTVGQRKGLGHGRRRGDRPRSAPSEEPGERRYAVSVDVESATVVVGPVSALLTDHVELTDLTWVDAERPVAGTVWAQSSAHGQPVRAQVEGSTVRFAERQRRVAPGQSVVFYDGGAGDEVLGGGIAT